MLHIRESGLRLHGSTKERVQWMNGDPWMSTSQECFYNGEKTKKKTKRRNPRYVIYIFSSYS